ncbi:unnamed protein product [Lymnaea stagnalis]|uniref:Ig-like domain-containing protein n=1 Tax=Lymnaea stagnalis TaxID=6523 RepID=A0AAV2HV96_LYMST
MTAGVTVWVVFCLGLVSADGPLGMTLDITPNSTSFDLCPSAPPNISVTCEGRLVNPGPPGYQIQIKGTDGNITWNSSHLAYAPTTGGIKNISCIASNRIYTDIIVAKSASITINEPPPRAPDLTIKNSIILNSSTMLHSSVMFNRTTVLLEEGMMEVACSVEGGFPEVSNVTVTCDSLFEETVSGNSLSWSHPVNWTSTNATCECNAQHVTGCYVSKSTLSLFVTSPLKWGTHAEFHEVTSVEIGGIVHFQLSVTGFPLPTEDSAHLKIGDSRLDRGRYNVTLKKSDIGNEASVWLEMRPQSDEDFNNYTLVMSNQVNQSLEISFRIVNADPSKEELNIVLIAGIAAPVGFIVIVIVIITVVFIVKKRKHKTDEDDGPTLEISHPIPVGRTSSTFSSLNSPQLVVQNEYVPFTEAEPVLPACPADDDLISIRPQRGDMADGQDQVPLQMANEEDQVPQHAAVLVAGGKMKNNQLVSNYNVNIKNRTLQTNSKQSPRVRFDLTGAEPEVGQGTSSGHPGQTTGRDNPGLTTGSGHAGQLTGIGHGGQLTGSGHAGQISISGSTNSGYDNVNIKNTTLQRETNSMKQLPNEDVSTEEQTEQGSRVKPTTYVNVHPQPLAVDTPPLQMNTKTNVEHEADNIVNPCDTPIPDDEITEGQTEQDSKVNNRDYDNVILKPILEDTPLLSMKTKKNVDHDADDIVSPCDTPSPEGDQLFQEPWFGAPTPSPEPLEQPAPHTRRSSGYVNAQPGPNDAPAVALTVSTDRTSDILNGT